MKIDLANLKNSCKRFKTVVIKYKKLLPVSFICKVCRFYRVLICMLLYIAMYLFEHIEEIIKTIRRLFLFYFVSRT